MKKNHCKSRASAIMAVIGDKETGQLGYTDYHRLFNGRSWFEYRPPTRADFDAIANTILKKRMDDTQYLKQRAAIINSMLQEIHHTEHLLTASSTLDALLEAYHVLYISMAVMFIYTKDAKTGAIEYELVRRWGSEPDPIRLRHGGSDA